MMQDAKQVSFALCPECFWLATYFAKNKKNCPQCNAKLTIQKVIVSQRVCTEESPQKKVLLEYA